MDDSDFIDELDFTKGNGDDNDAVAKIAKILPRPLGPYLAKGSAKQRKIKCAFLSTICIVIILLIFTSIGLTLFFILDSSSSSDDGSDTIPPPSDNSTIPPSPPTNASIPNIPKNFQTDYTSTIFFGEIPNTISGTFYNSGDQQVDKFVYVAYLPGAYPDYPLNSTIISNENQTYLLSNNICRESDDTYDDPFDFFDDADYEGNVTVNGLEYTWWTVNYTTVEYSYFISFYAQGDIPYQFNQTFISSYFNFSEIVQYDNFAEATYDDPNFWNIPDSCDSELICPPQTQEIQGQVFYRYHASDDWQVENKNFADLAGVTSFLCWNYMYSYYTDPYNEVVSHYEVAVNTTWGEYGKCNFDNCWGSDDFTVGHAATGGITEDGGQCSDNSDVGNWYSLTNVTQCNSGYSPYTENDCAWQVNAISNNITVDCILSNGFIDACRNNAVIPFPDAVTILDHSFTVCPPVSMSTYDNTTMIRERSVQPSFPKGLHLPHFSSPIVKQLYEQIFAF